MNEDPLRDFRANCESCASGDRAGYTKKSHYLRCRRHDFTVKETQWCHEWEEKAPCAPSTSPSST